jgi:hypothetical protein
MGGAWAWVWGHTALGYGTATTTSLGKIKRTIQGIRKESRNLGEARNLQNKQNEKQQFWELLIRYSAKYRWQKRNRISYLLKHAND